MLYLKYYLSGNFKNLKIYSMKIKVLIVMTSVIALMLGSCANDSLKNAKIKSAEDSLSYAFGIVNYNQLKLDSLSLDPILVAKAMQDGKSDSPVMTDADARTFIMAFINKRDAIRASRKAIQDKETYKEYIAQNEAFLATNKAKAGVTTTASGLQYEVIKLGKGPKPTPESTVKVHYVGNTMH